jgi:cytochrome c oxidase cbb3-type subunit III
MIHPVIQKISHFAVGMIALFLPVIGMAQTAAAPVAPAAEEPVYSVYSDPVFYGLVLVAIVLLIFILQLQKIFSSVAQEFGKGKFQNNSGRLSALLALAGILFLPELASAAAPEQASFLKHGFGSNALNALFFLILFEIAVVLYYVRLIRSFTEKAKEEEAWAEMVRTKPSFWEKFNQSVAVEKEATILTDHDYDGIRELDNALPPWWKYGFYLTIVWAVVYLIHFHVAGSGPSSEEEYTTEMTEASAEIAAYVAKLGNLVDETNVNLITDATELAKGQEVFVSLCSACHGKAGEGLVGPNMTDAYWKHGGGIRDLFKTVKYGVAGTGMKSWKTDLSPAQMANVCSYILTLQGTNPPNPKAPEGTLYVPASADTTSAQTPNPPLVDSTGVAAVQAP